MVYDITRRDTLSNEAAYWLKDLKTNAPTHCIIGLAGNKVDLHDNRQLSFQDLIDWAQSNGINHYKEVSAKTDSGVHDIFQSICNELDQRREEIQAADEQFRRETFQLDNADKIAKKKSKCRCTVF